MFVTPVIKCCIRHVQLLHYICSTVLRQNLNSLFSLCDLASFRLNGNFECREKNLTVM
jgi:hypothetical protein